VSNVFDKVRQQIAQGVLDDVKRIPKIPTVRAAKSEDAVLPAVTDMKAAIDNLQGLISPLDKALTLRDLLQAGVIKIKAGNDIVGGGVITVGSGGSTVPATDFFGNPVLIVPPTPTALKASGTYKAVILTWEYIAYGNHAYTEIWRSSVDNLATATLIGTSGGKVYVDENATTLGVLRYYWVRLVGTAPATAPGAYNATAGVPGGAGLIGNLDLGPLIVEAANLAGGAVTTAKFASTIEPISLVSSVPGVLVTKTIFNTADGKLYRWNGSAYVSTVAAPDITGLLTDAQLAAIAATKITGTLTDAQLSAIAAAKVTGTLVASQLAINIGGGNLAVNSSFENAASLTPWVHSGSTFTESISTTQKHHGAQTLKLVGSGGVDPFMYQSVPVQPSTQYVFTAWLYVQSITAGVTGNRSILIYDGFGSAQDVSLSSSHATGVWVRKQVTLVTNAAATALEVRLYAPNGTVYWDAVQVEQGDTPTAYAPKPDEILPNTITVTEIADNAITTPKLIALAVAAGKIAANAISATELQAGSVTTTKILAGNVTATEIAAGTIVAGNIAAATITGTQIAAATIAAANIVGNTITAAQIAAATITGTQIAATTIAAGNLIAGTITANELAANSVTLGKVAAGAINAAQINTGQIQATHMGANSIAVGTAAIQNAAITNAMMANLSVDTAQIVDLAVSTAKINNLAVDTAKLNNLAVTNAKINDLDAAKITAGSIAAARIAAGSIDATKIDSRSLTIKDAGGTVIFSSSVPLGTANAASGLVNANVTLGANGALSGAGGGTATLSGMGAGLFATLNQINSGNASTYIANAAIAAAHIGSLDAGVINAGAIRGININAASHTTVGSFLTTSAAAAATTLNVQNTVDFPTSGSGYIFSGTNPDDVFAWTGKTATTLTGCTGVLAHGLGDTVVPLAKGIFIDANQNEMRFFGDGGGGIEPLASIGVTGVNVANCAVFGSRTPGNVRRGAAIVSYGDHALYLESLQGASVEAYANATFGHALLHALPGRPSDRRPGQVAMINTTGGTTDARTASPQLMITSDGTNWHYFTATGVWNG
jgi:hypothetical protein